MPKPTLNWLLVFLPVAVCAEHAQPEAHRPIFISAALAIIPLAGMLGLATWLLSEATVAGKSTWFEGVLLLAV